MARALKEYRIFFASPGGLQAERRAFRDIVTEYDDLESNQRGVHFVPVGWEDTLPGVGRPQAIINEEIQTCDYFILTFWNRWGSAPDNSQSSSFTSGTEEEYHVARACHDDPKHCLRQIVVFFKGVGPEQLADPGPQLRKVLDFRNRLESERQLLFRTFDDLAQFQRSIRGLLGQWKRDHEDGNLQKAPSFGPKTPLMPTPGDEIPHPPASAPHRTLLEEAWVLSEEGKITEAETRFARAIASGDDPEAFRSYGAFLLRSGRYAQAEVMFDRILELTSPGDKVWQAIAYGNIGLVRDFSGDFAGATDMHRKSLAIHQELARADGIAQAQNNLGIIAKREGDLGEAERLFQLARDNGRTADRPDIVGRALNNLGLLYREKGDLERSEQTLREALTIAEDRGKPEGIATACVNLGTVNFDLGMVSAASSLFDRSLSLSRQIGFPEGIATSSASLAALLLSQGDVTAAEPLLRETLRINMQMNRPESTASAFLNLGVFEARRGDAEAARRLLQTAVDTYEEVGEPLGQASAEENLGEIYRSLGDSAGARQIWEKACERFASLGLQSRANRVRERLDTLL
jgi:tetratricopeptide (TPR) repeat protein